MTSAPSSGGGEQGEPRVVVRDKRRIDPESGLVREPDVSGEPAESKTTLEGEADERLGELTDTLQRLKAEYDNYRRRAERERTAVVELATGSALVALLPILDDIERARAHGDLTGAFGTVGEALIAVTNKLGLESYGSPGEPFDPQIHEAVMQAPPAQDSDLAVVAEVFRPGYRHGGRVLRPAQVSVSEAGGGGMKHPADADAHESTDGGETTPPA
jgi:molecular chaperone GrpE